MHNLRLGHLVKDFGLLALWVIEFSRGKGLTLCSSGVKENFSGHWGDRYRYSNDRRASWGTREVSHPNRQS